MKYSHKDTIPSLAPALMHRVLALAFMLFLIASCEKLDLPTQENSPASGSNQNPTDTEKADDTPTMDSIIRYMKTHGDEDNPFTVSDFKTTIPTYLVYKGASGISEAWICGYIVGYIDGTSITKTIFAAGNTETNIVLADSPSEQDYNNCIAIQLTLNSTNSIATRSALNLSAHPENLGKQVLLFGNIDTYMRTLGLKSTRSYAFFE